jgi:upstream activation factor subunit UAF30
MAFDFDSLESYIEEILTAPGTDLATISAKRVRKQLQHIDPSLTTAFLKEHREAVDVVISRVFEKVQGAGGSQDSEVEEPLAPMSRKRRQTPDDGYSVPQEEDATDVEDTPPPAKKAKKAVKRELTDAELARQLSSEINGRARRSSGKPKPAVSNGTPKKRKSKAKSAALVDTDDDSDSNEGKPSKKKSGDGGSARGGFAKPYLLRYTCSPPVLARINFFCSEPLAAVLGVESMSRPQVVKQLWAYIKSNELVCYLVYLLCRRDSSYILTRSRIPRTSGRSCVILLLDLSSM